MIGVCVRYLLDIVIWSVSTYVIYNIYGTGLVFSGILSNTLVFTLLGVFVMSAVMWFHRLFYYSWRRVSIPDLLVLLRVVALTTCVIISIDFVFNDLAQTRSGSPILCAAMGLLFMAGVRVIRRVTSERLRPDFYALEVKSRILIIGAGEAGSMVVREMLRHPESGRQPVAFLDDDIVKQRQYISGIPIVGKVNQLPEIVKKFGINEIIIAAPSATGEFVQRVVRLAREINIKYRIIPGMYELLDDNVQISHIRDVAVEDLLRREPVRLNDSSISQYLKDRVVLVTGAGGSIGSEIVERICEFKPRLILLLGRGENSIFETYKKLDSDEMCKEISRIALIGDVRDRSRLQAIFEEHRPQVVFHAGAHKHVPLMEDAPSEAILNNVIGTKNIVELCLEYAVERLVNISTDKAVNPTSVMGASKRIAEMLVSVGAAKAGVGQSFVSVRFGNVLGSRGSVVPAFMDQIKRGGPVEITHREMTRYFMLIPEAARLVLQAGGLAENGKVYVLNMGKPVKIIDLAKDVIALSGAKDVEIKVVGVRPGEKLYEELLTTAEDTEATSHSEIFSAKLEKVNEQRLNERVCDLEKMAHRNDCEAIRKKLAELIPENKFGSIG